LKFLNFLPESLRPETNAYHGNRIKDPHLLQGAKNKKNETLSTDLQFIP
jgi:hypothetical protein